MIPKIIARGRRGYVFFDLGGTILDLSCCYLGIARAWEEMNIPSGATPAELTRRWADASQELISSRRPRGNRGIFEITCDAMASVLEELEISGNLQVAEGLTVAAWEAVREHAAPFPDATPAVFRSLTELGYALGIITDGDQEVTEALLPRVPCLELFDPIVCSWQVGAAKPDRLIFERAIALSGCVPEESVFVGDAPSDVQGAKALGMKSVIVDRAGKYPGRPIPDLIVRSVKELPAALSSLKLSSS